MQKGRQSENEFVGVPSILYRTDVAAIKAIKKKGRGMTNILLTLLNKFFMHISAICVRFSVINYLSAIGNIILINMIEERKSTNC